MKNLIYFFIILIVLSKTGNVLSDNNLFNVNNIEIKKGDLKSNEKLINKAFQLAFYKLSDRLFMENDIKKLSNINLEQIRRLISYYQISNETKNNIETVKVNVFFDKDRLHDFFYQNNILYSDVINTEVILFPLLKKKDQYFIYTQNYFYDNWVDDKSEKLIQYILPSENIENIEKINALQNNIEKFKINDFFKEYEKENIVFAHIDIKKNLANVFLNLRVDKKEISKRILLKNDNKLNQKDFYNKIILNTDKEIKDVIKSQNLIDVRTPSFLNAKIYLNRKNSLVDFNEKLKKIELIENFQVQQFSKDIILVKIKYLGKITKIISKLEDQNIRLKLVAGEWQLKMI